MLIRDDKIPKSSFLAMEKDLNLIIDKMLKNNRLKNLLYYTNPRALQEPNLTEEESLALLKKNIKIVPKLYIDSAVLNYVNINFDHFTPNVSNPEYRDSVIIFDIICHTNQWQLQDFQLRPYKIAAEIDSMFNNQHLTGIGTLQFLSADQLIIDDEFAGLVLMYQATNGEEDRKKPLNPHEVFECV